MGACVMRTAALALLLLARAPAATAGTVISYQGPSRIETTLGIATFDALAPGADLEEYSEGGLIITAAGEQHTDEPFGWGMPPVDIDMVDCVVPNPPAFRPGGGVHGLIVLRRADEQPILALEMTVNVFESTDQQVHLWVLALRGGIVRGEFDMDVFCGARVGVQGVFDELRAGAYADAATRDEHGPSNLNLLAIDDVTFGEPEGTARFFTDPAAFDAAAAAAGHVPTASWALQPHALGAGGAVAINGIPALDRFTHQLDPDDPWTSDEGFDLWPADLDSVRFAINQDPQGSLVPLGPNALGFFATGALPDVTQPALVDNFLSKSFTIVAGEPVDRCHSAFALELVSLVGSPGLPALLNVTVYDESDLGAGAFLLPAATGQPTYLGVLRDGGMRIGRVDVWDSNGFAEGLVSVTPYRLASNCPPDLDGSGTIDFDDVLELLQSWGGGKGDPADLDGDGDVDFGDLLLLLGYFGPCPDCWPPDAP